MADGTVLNKGVGGDTILTDDLGATKVQVEKAAFGPDGELTLVSSASPLPTVDDKAVEELQAVIAALAETLGVEVVTEPATKADGGEGLPAVVKIIGGYDGTNTQALATDSSGILQADIANEPNVKLGAALPAGTNNIGDVDVLTLPALPAGTNAIGKLAANSGVDIGDVDVTSIAAGSNLIGNVGLGVRTSGGLTIFRSLDIDETEEDVKTSAGQLYWYHYANRTAEELFLKFYNATATTVTVGSTTPALTIPLAKETQGHVPIPQGFAFSTAISVACVKGVADSSNTGPAANGCVINLGYA